MYVKWRGNHRVNVVGTLYFWHQFRKKTPMYCYMIRSTYGYEVTVTAVADSPQDILSTVTTPFSHYICFHLFQYSIVSAVFLGHTLILIREIYVRPAPLFQIQINTYIGYVLNTWATRLFHIDWLYTCERTVLLAPNEKRVHHMQKHIHILLGTWTVHWGEGIQGRWAQWRRRANGNVRGS